MGIWRWEICYKCIHRIPVKTGNLLQVSSSNSYEDVKSATSVYIKFLWRREICYKCLHQIPVMTGNLLQVSSSNYREMGNLLHVSSSNYCEYGKFATCVFIKSMWIWEICYMCLHQIHVKTEICYKCLHQIHVKTGNMLLVSSSNSCEDGKSATSVFIKFLWRWEICSKCIHQIPVKTANLLQVSSSNYY